MNLPERLLRNWPERRISDAWRENQIDLAEMTWARAFEFETTNPGILVEHAAFLKTAGRNAEAKILLKQVTNGSWQPRFSKTIEQAETILQSP